MLRLYDFHAKEEEEIKATKKKLAEEAKREDTKDLLYCIFLYIFSAVMCASLYVYLT